MKKNPFLLFAIIALSACDKPSSPAANNLAKETSGPTALENSSDKPEETEPPAKPFPTSRKERDRPEPADGKELSHPTAAVGAPGFVISPHTGKEADVRGIPPGTVLHDPTTLLGDKFFRIPNSTGDVPAEVPVAAPVPIATKVEGKSGFVFSPYNGKVVDVRGIKPTSLVSDPTFPAAEKKFFRVPE